MYKLFELTFYVNRFACNFCTFIRIFSGSYLILSHCKIQGSRERVRNSDVQVGLGKTFINDWGFQRIKTFEKKCEKQKQNRWQFSAKHFPGNHFTNFIKTLTKELLNFYLKIITKKTAIFCCLNFMFCCNFNPKSFYRFGLKKWTLPDFK